MEIHHAARDDLPALMELWKEFMDHHQAVEPHYTRAPEGHLRWAEWLGTKLEDPDSCLLVADETGRGVVGYCLAMAVDYPPILTSTRYGFVQDLAVTADHRGRGIGRLLYEAVETWLRSRGIDRVELHVIEANRNAGRFWRRMGYSPFVQRLAKRI